MEAAAAAPEEFRATPLERPSDTVIAQICSLTNISADEATDYFRITGSLEGAVALHWDSVGSDRTRKADFEATSEVATTEIDREDDSSSDDDPDRLLSGVSTSSSFNGESDDVGDTYGDSESQASFYSVILTAAVDATNVSHMGTVSSTRERGMDAEVFIQIRTDHLDASVALAWGIERDKMITIHLNIDYPMSAHFAHDDFTALKLASKFSVQSVSQEGATKRMKVGNQLKRIIENWCHAAGESTPDTEHGLKQWAAHGGKGVKSKNLLVRFISYIHFRLSRLHHYCTICDQLQQDTLSMVMPSVCSRTLCVYSWGAFEKLRMSDPTGGGRSDLVTLLRAFFITAVASERVERVLDPWPLVYKRDQSVLLGKDTPIEELRAIALTAMDEQPQMPCASCASKPEGSAPPECPLCGLESWVISSNRSMIVPIPPEFQYKELCTSRQFLLLSNPPELEARFQAHKRIHGSRFFFHGSPTDNWHSIMRNGFFVASGDKAGMQLHGAAHGVGVYVAPQLRSSHGYTRLFGGGRGGFRGSSSIPECAKDMKKVFQILCVAICEVVSAPEVKDAGWCKVIPDAELILPRFLIVWDTSTNFGTSGSCDSTHAIFETWCRERILYNGHGPLANDGDDDGD